MQQGQARKVFLLRNQEQSTTKFDAPTIGFALISKAV